MLGKQVLGYEVNLFLHLINIDATHALLLELFLHYSVGFYEVVSAKDVL